MLSNSKIMTSSSNTKIRLIFPNPMADGLKSDSLKTSSLGGAVTETYTYYFGVLSVVPYALMETAYGTIFPSGPY